MSTLTIVPAYGRDYTSEKAALADWNAGKDFRIEPQGCYVNNVQRKELLANGVFALKVRYNKQRSVLVVKL